MRARPCGRGCPGRRTCSARSTNGGAGQLAPARPRPASPNPGGAFSPVPTAVPPIASCSSPSAACSSSAIASSQRAGVARPLLADGQRGGVLQVGAADLDDVGPLLGLGRRWRRAAAGARGSCCAVDHRVRGDVHRGRERVVGRLAHVDVVVGVHRRLACPASPPTSWMHRLAITSLTFMFDCVPDPVCHTYSGNSSSSSPPMTSSPTRSMSSALPVRQPAGRGVDDARRPS